MKHIKTFEGRRGPIKYKDPTIPKIKQNIDKKDLKMGDRILYNKNLYTHIIQKEGLIIDIDQSLGYLSYDVQIIPENEEEIWIRSADVVRKLTDYEIAAKKYNL